jgi:hypothetical protein
MLIKLQPLFYSLLFLAGLEIFVFFREFIIYALIFLFFISFFQAKKIGKKWSYAIIPVLFCISSTSLLYLIGLSYERQVFIILSSAVYYLSLFGSYRLAEYPKDKTAKGMIAMAAMASIFFVFASAYGLYLNFLVPLYWLIIVYMLATLLVSYQYFSILKEKIDKSVWAYSFLLALAMAEIIWTMNYWPFGYLTTGVIALIIYFVLWELTRSYMMETLNRKKAILSLVSFFILVSMVLLSSKWMPAF